MDRIRQLGLVLLLLAVAGCSDDSQKAAGDGTADAARDDDAAHGLCALFDPEEIQELLGARVGDGQTAGPLGTACQWDGNEDGVYVQIQVLAGTEYWEKPSLAPGYQAIEGLGHEAYVVPDLGGWRAGALTDDAVAIVSMNGNSADRERTVKLLRRLMARM